MYNIITAVFRKYDTPNEFGRLPPCNGIIGKRAIHICACPNKAKTADCDSPCDYNVGSNVGIIPDTGFRNGKRLFSARQAVANRIMRIYLCASRNSATIANTQFSMKTIKNRMRPYPGVFTDAHRPQNQTAVVYACAFSKTE